MSYKVIFFDMDGTLLNEQKQIPEDTREALRQLQESGIHTVIATGRSPFHVRELAEDLGIDTLVCFNGAYVEHKGDVVYSTPIDVESIEKLYQLVMERNHALVYLSGDSFYATHEENEMVNSAVSSILFEPPGMNAEVFRDKPIYQCWLHCAEGEEEVYEQDDALTNVRFFRWHNVSLDVMPKDGSKAKGIEALLQHLTVDKSEAVAFGDGKNDIEMIGYVGMGVAMGNAHPEVFPHANYVTKHVDEGGISHALRELNILL
ncbi:Cof-type HAD-IIB family hydrolase [Brevibacillus laterosporus]|uniref:Cof-type HAD-IIB family hydrolase n=1 Tax=Brevibacillus laterosporus TaxID=1465 RepID=UPI0018F88685|nr:Cof-type HAD-IIB family hydrolase [Brevibacillus laterosporus]MBG9773485.1 hydrolase Cof [Brevibacillus laterosporus]